MASKARLDRQVSQWKSELSNVRPYYAVKCNPEPNLIEWLAPHAAFDCASSREIQIVCEHAPRSDIIFANPCKKKEDIEFAQESGVQITVVDSKEELKKLDDCAWEGSSLIRIMVDDKGSKMPFSSKFGIHLSHAMGIYGEAQKLGQKISGISFHVGSGCIDANQYYEAILNANSLISLLEPYNHTNNKKNYIIDIGGGFEDHSFDSAAVSIRRSRGFIPSNIELIAEPGRFFAASSHDLFVKVIGKKPAASGFRYTIDESLYGQFSCIPFDQAKPRWIRVRAAGEPQRRRCQGVLYGRTCDGLDLIAVGEAEELEVDDILWFSNMGAYTSVTASEFNNFPPPQIIINDSLPDISEFQKEEWPTNLRYASHVKAPEY